MEVVENNYKIKIKCTNCGSILRAERSEVTKKIESCYFHFYSSCFNEHYYISQCPCCRKEKVEVKILT